MNKFVIIGIFVGALVIVVLLVVSFFGRPATHNRSPNIPVGSALPTVTPIPSGSSQPAASFDTRPNPSSIDTYFQSIKQSNPDVYVHSKLPYSNDLFSIQDKSFTVSPTVKYSFLIILKGPDKQADQNSVKSWLQSLGLNDSQIQSLDITYQ